MICWRSSGAALTRNQCSPSRLMAIEAWLARNAGSARPPLQLSQPQFHCGTPPPAAAPSTTMLIMTGIRGRPVPLLAGRASVHVDFHADGHFDDLGLVPGHDASPHLRHYCRDTRRLGT